MPKILTGKEAEIAESYFLQAVQAAYNAQCLSSQRGVILVKEGFIISRGWNTPPDGKRCGYCLRDIIKEATTEPCRALHAEQLAILNAYRSERDLRDSRMYHIKVKNGEIRKSGPPSCTICSKLILASGISEFALWEEEGIKIYTAQEFNNASFNYLEKK